MSRPRVVITGLSAITPLGNDLETTWKRLLAGESGIGPITLFDAADYDSRVAGEVKDFVAEDFIPAKQARRMDRFTQFAVVAAQQLLKDSGHKFDYPVEWGIDLQTEHERYLTEQVFNKPVFVTDYPKEIKAFYMRMNDDGKTVAAADCLVPGIGEIIGGSQREERLDLLTKRMQELGLREEDYWWYLDLRRYGSCRHAGFGLGFERMVMYLTGVSNIRDVELHPRTVGNADF